MKEKNMKIIVCGGRDYLDKKHLFAFMSKFHERTPITEIIEGGARGADRLAAEWGIKNNVKTSIFIAAWSKYGKSAGYVRNKLMLDQKPDCIVAFPGGRGTTNMCYIANKAGIKVYDGANMNF